MNLTFTIIAAPDGHTDEIGQVLTLTDIAQFLEVNAYDLGQRSVHAFQIAADAYIFDIHHEEENPFH